MRYPPLTIEEMTPRQREVADAISQRRADDLTGPYSALLYSPEIADRVQLLGQHLRFNLRTPERLRALAVLVSARKHGSADFELFVTQEDVRQSGLSQSVISDLTQGRRPSDMKPDEVAVYDFCTEISLTGRVKSATFDRLANIHGREICLELVEVCGFTAFLITIVNVTQTNFRKGS